MGGRLWRARRTDGRPRATQLYRRKPARQSKPARIPSGIAIRTHSLFLPGPRSATSRAAMRLLRGGSSLGIVRVLRRNIRTGGVHPGKLLSAGCSLKSPSGYLCFPVDACAGQTFGQVLRERRFEDQPFSRHRVRQGESGAVQKHAPQPPLALRHPVEGEVAVFRIPDDGMADGVQVPADLMGAARLDGELEQRRLRSAGELPPARERGLPIDASQPLRGVRLLVLGEAQIDAAFLALEAALGEGQIRLVRLAG